MVIAILAFNFKAREDSFYCGVKTRNKSVLINFGFYDQFDNRKLIQLFLNLIKQKTKNDICLIDSNSGRIIDDRC